VHAKRDWMLCPRYRFLFCGVYPSPQPHLHPFFPHNATSVGYPLQFHDGPSLDNSTLRQLSGSGAGVVVTSSGPYLSARLTSDSSIQYSGFFATLSGEGLLLCFVVATATYQSRSVSYIMHVCAFLPIWCMPHTHPLIYGCAVYGLQQKSQEHFAA
jgi:hypothetical protein